ncbi:helix-turn-helix domain-containing protein [Prevotella sp. A2931]|uniref:Helix-turn-helix domain-containing protein n=1 Tax=Prevotella illustrans TaxID=2800387 RepID=A0ABS3M411_9BACT|nr:MULTISPECIES: two-component regulator propeller domain-containing protein [Prevotella]MBO1362894.1 helix-turn-helix domain-containing protein [Prevotella illustrans]
MSNSSVNVIFQDSQGIMWFGTWDGLNKYDGHDFEWFSSSISDTTTLTNPIIRNILEEDSDHLWIVTDGGINRLDKKTKITKRFYLDSKIDTHYRENVFKCATDTKGNVIANHLHGHLYLFNKKLEKFQQLQISFQDDIAFLQFDAYNRLWIGTSSSLKCFHLIKNKLLKIKEHKLPSETKYVPKSQYRQVFLKNGNTLLTIDKSGNLTPTNYQTDEEVLCAVSKGEQLFIGTNDGCAIYRQGSKHTILKGNSISSILLGTQNILWLGTDGKGAYQYFNSNSFISSPKLGNITSPVRAILRDGKTLWLGSKGNGLSSYKIYSDDSLRLIKNYNVGPGRSNNAVFSITKGSDGRLWLGTDGIGIPYIRQETLQRMKFRNKSDEHEIYSVYSIVQDNDTTLYLATSGNGIVKVNFQANIVTRIKKYTEGKTNDKLKSNVVYTLINDGKHLWAGTRGGGVSRMDKSTGLFRTYRNIPNDNSSLGCNDVIAMLRDHKNRIWIGTTQGLNRMESGNANATFTRYIKTCGLSNTNIHGICEDLFHNIWVSTSKGVARIDETGNNTINFHYRDGLQGNEFSDGAYYTTNEGNALYFGGTNGISTIFPMQIEENKFMPKLLVNKISIDNEDVVWNGKSLVTSHQARTIEVSFSLLDFINNNRCELAYWLESSQILGSGKESWTNVGENKKIILSKLFPGKYVLHVKQSNSNHLWAEKTLDISIEIKFPLWARWWAVMLYMIAIILLVRYIYFMKKTHIEVRHEMQLEHQKMQSREDVHQAKLKFFANVAGRFTNNITQIYDALEMLKQNTTNHANKKYMHRIDANVLQMNRQIRQLIDIQSAETNDADINPEETDLMNSIKMAFDDFSIIINQKNINLLIANRQNIANITTDKTILDKALNSLLNYIIPNAIADSTIEVTHQKRDNKWMVTYNYLGNSPSKEEIDIIYNKYKALENFENRLSDGKNDHAIGLTVCNDLLQRIEGELIIDTEINSFVITLSMLKPNKKRSVPNKVDPITQFIGNKRKTILLIERDESMTRLIINGLNNDYHILPAEIEDDAYHLLEANTVDLIIYDLTGHDLHFIDTVKSNETFKYIPLAVMTTENSQEHHVDIIRKGANSIIVKPFRMDYFSAMADRIISEKQKIIDFTETSTAYIRKYDSKKLSDNDRKFLTLAIEKLKESYMDEDYSPDRLAEDMAVSRTQLYRKMKLLINHTPYDFILDYRMKQAEKLLKNSKKTISEIIADCGFRNRSFFYREFSKLHGCSPKDYRKVIDSERP